MKSIRAKRYGAVSVSLLLIISSILVLGSNITVVHAAPSSTVTIHVGHSPDAVCVDPSRNLVYVANAYDNTVSVINGSTNAIMKSVAVGDEPDAIAVNPSTGTVYVADLADNNVSVIDELTNIVVRNVSVGNSPDALAIDTAKNIIYVANQDDNTVSVINGSTNVVIEGVAVGASPDALAVDSSNSLVYVANSFEDTVSVINGSMNKVIATIPVGGDPAGIAVDSSSRMIYVTNFDDWTVSVINGSNRSLVATVTTVGASPDAIAVDEITNAIYVVSYDNDSLSMIDGASNVVVANVTVGQPLEVAANPLAVAVNPLTNVVYTANNDTLDPSHKGTISVADGLKRASQTYVICSSSSVAIGESTACSAVIVGASPSGQVIWDSTGVGSFVSTGASSCTISGNACTVSWQPSLPISGSPVQITATFLGDLNNKGSSGRFQLSVSEAANSTSVAGAPRSVEVFFAGLGVGALVAMVGAALYLVRIRGRMDSGPGGIRQLFLTHFRTRIRSGRGVGHL